MIDILVIRYCYYCYYLQELITYKYWEIKKDLHILDRQLILLYIFKIVLSVHFLQQCSTHVNVVDLLSFFILDRSKSCKSS